MHTSASTKDVLKDSSLAWFQKENRILMEIAKKVP